MPILRVLGGAYRLVTKVELIQFEAGDTVAAKNTLKVNRGKGAIKELPNIS